MRVAYDEICQECRNGLDAAMLDDEHGILNVVCQTARGIPRYNEP